MGLKRPAHKSNLSRSKVPCGFPNRFNATLKLYPKPDYVLFPDFQSRHAGLTVLLIVSKFGGYQSNRGTEYRHFQTIIN